MMFTIAIPAIAVTITLVLVRILLTVAFLREAFMKLKDIKKFAKNDEVPVPVA